MSPPRHITLAPLCAAAGAGRRDALTLAAQAALDADCTPEEVREALLTVAPFCGFPRALDAFAAVSPLLGAAAHPADDPAAFASRGVELFDRVYGKDADRVRANLAAADAELSAWVQHDAYGKILSRPGIPASLRERIGVVLLVAQSLRRQLSGHIRGALNCGATVAEVSEFLDAAAPYLDADEVAFAREALAREALARVDRG